MRLKRTDKDFCYDIFCVKRFVTWDSCMWELLCDSFFSIFWQIYHLWEPNQLVSPEKHVGFESTNVEPLYPYLSFFFSTNGETPCCFPSLEGREPCKTVTNGGWNFYFPCQKRGARKLKKAQLQKFMQHAIEFLDSTLKPFVGRSDSMNAPDMKMNELIYKLQ